jgi:hypothetical protein|tara:strand:+ start:2343 stop:2696 length:354 start_codon:yes stop_codon:yes gene_type:complete
MLKAEQINEELPYFTGTEHYYKYLSGLKLTDGVKFLADSCECYWFIDIIASYQSKVGNERLQSWNLFKDNVLDKWVVVCEDGNYKKLVRQEIGYSDFPLERIDVWVSNGVVMLKSEY